MPRFLTAVVLTLGALAISADTLSTVRTAMKGLTGKQPVHGQLTIEQRVKSEGRFSNENTARVVTADVRHDAGGVSILIPQPLVDKATQQAWSPTVGENTAQDAIGTVRALTVVEALNFREPLLALLKDAAVTQEKRLPFRGAPARQLLLKLKTQRRKESGSIQLGTVKSDDTMTLWVGDDNLPLAAERVTKTTAGFMLLHGTYSGRASYTFGHAGDRLVLLRLETSDGGSGMGQNIQKTSVQTLLLQ
jgi:hypothetical protein